MDSLAVFSRVIDAYAVEGFPHRLIGQWTLPENDVNDLVGYVRAEAPKSILEVGTFVGLSTMIMALCTDEDTRIVTIDPNLPLRREMGSMGSELGDIDADVTTLAVAMRVAKRLGVEKRVTFVEGGFSSSATFSSRRQDPSLSIPIVGPEICRQHGPFDLAFIDGLHYADVVESDLDLAQRHLRNRGVALMHDCVGMWGTNVRTGIGRFLDRCPEWSFLHPPFAALYRSIGIVFRREDRPDFVSRLLDQPALESGNAAYRKALAVSLVDRLRPDVVLEASIGLPVLAPAFEGLGDVRSVDLRVAGTTEFARALDEIASTGNKTLVVSAGAPDLMSEEDAIGLFRAIANSGATAAILRTPPGERGAACKYSRPLRSWLRMAEEAQAKLREIPAIDLAPSSFLFRRALPGAAPNTSLCHVTLITPKDAHDETSVFPLIALSNTDAIEQNATLQIHYSGGFKSIFEQLDSRPTNSQEAMNLQKELFMARLAKDYWQSVASVALGSALARSREPAELRCGRASAREARLIASAVAHAKAASSAEGVCIALNRNVGIAEIAALAERSELAGICVLDRSEFEDVDYLDRTKIGGGHPIKGWRIPAGVNRLYFTASPLQMPRSLLETCWRSGVTAVFARLGGWWVPISLDLLRRSYIAAHACQARVRGLFELLIGFTRKTLPAFAHFGMTSTEAFQHIVASGKGSGGFEPGRVVHVCGTLSPGGAERQCANTVIGLVRTRAVTPLLLAHFLNSGPAHNDFHAARIAAEGVEVREIERAIKKLSDLGVPEVLRSVASAIPEELLVDIANLVREFERVKPEVVHCWLDWDNVRAGLAAILAGVPKVVLSGRNLAPNNFKLHQPYMDPAYRALAAVPRVRIINNSRAGADSYADWIGIDRDRVSVVHNGFDPASFAPVDAQTRTRVRALLGIQESEFIVGGVFRFEEEKQPLLWLEAACLAARELPTARFVIYGQGSLREAMERQIEASEHRDRFILPGVTDAPVAAMASMDVFMLTSFGEGLPNVLIEAQAAGTFVITTPAGGAPEAIEPGVTGWVCEGEAAQLAKHIVSANQCEELRAYARRSAPQIVRERFGIERMVEATLRLYDVKSNALIDGMTDA